MANTRMTVELYRQALGIAQDDLIRARSQQRATPGWVSGNGEEIDEVVRGYERRVAAIKRNARKEGIEV